MDDEPGPPDPERPDQVGPASAGLDDVEVARRRAEHGPNRLPVPAPIPAWRALVAELTHFFARMLWVAAVLAVVAGLPQLAVAIAVVVVVNGVFAFWQERRAEAAAERLRDLLPRRVWVRRGGRRVQVDATELVVGDVVLLEAGDRVPADVALGKGEGVAVDESTLTGESVPTTPAAGDPAWAGTHLVGGEVEATVVAVGAGTRLAHLAALTAGARRDRSPLAAELDRLVRTVAAIAVGVGVGFFGVALAIDMEPSDGFLFAVGVTVALVPEGLLPTVTLSLAMGAQRMAERDALVRHLEAVETLGATTFICSDKTGTLTRNEMAVVEVWTPAGSVTVHGTGYGPEAEVAGSPAAVTAAAGVATAARRCSTGRADLHRPTGADGAPDRTRNPGGRAGADPGGWVAAGDPMEAAIDALARRLGAGADEPGGVDDLVTARFAFDPERRRASVVAAGRLVVKGAPESVRPCCVDDPSTWAEADAVVERMAAAGLRVLAVAERTERTGDASGTDPEAVERDLHLAGLLGFLDPPRDGVPEAIAACRAAGVKVAMLTGDHHTTARAIADQIGLLGPEALVVEGRDLPADEAALGELLDRDGVVISRVDPEDKLRIARALRARGHVVAMTGDGVNDGPALREADIGVAMGRSGTDVAREAADLVLLDDDFATIVAAIEQGRATFADIRRFLTYHLTDNVAELAPFVVWALSGGSIPLALGVLQILALDIGTDLLPALALGAEPPDRRGLEHPVAGRRFIDRALLRRVFGVLGPTEAAVELAAFGVTLWLAGWRIGDGAPPAGALAAASGAAFTAVVLGQAANAFACRSTTHPPWHLDRTNPLMVRAVAAELVVLVVFLYVGPVAGLLDHAGPTWAGGAVALAAVPAVLGVDAATKRRRRCRPIGA